MPKLSPRNRILKERMVLMRDEYSFFGYLALGLEPVETRDLPIPTMATDGKHLFYHPDFVNNVPPEQLRGTLVHEVLHCALGHIWRRGGREFLKWNYATDFAINLIVTKEGLQLPPGILLDKKYEGMSAERIYDLLPDPKTIKGRLADSHHKWPGKPNKNQGTSTESNDNQDGNNISAQDVNKENQDLADQWKDRIARAANFAKGRGHLPGSIAKLVEDILEPKQDWKTLLRDKVISTAKNDFRFYPPAKKHLWRGIYLPSVYGEKLEIACAIDTSGSVSKKQFQEFMAETRGLTDQFEDYTLHLFFCDAGIHDYFEITPQDVWPKFFPKHGGGTAFEPVFAEIEKRRLEISALVYQTDGMGSYPARPPEYPVIWLLNQEYNVPWGEKIIMETQ